MADTHPLKLAPVIQALECNYTKILYLCKDVPIEELNEPVTNNGWSVKDVLAHLAAWNWRCISLLAAAHYTDWPLKANPDVEGLNREFYQERKGWSWNEAETDFRRAHQGLIRAIEELPAGRRESELVRQTIVEEVLDHYLTHLPDLERWYKESVVPLAQ